jgi:hypothetical protein
MTTISSLVSTAGAFAAGVEVVRSFTAWVMACSFQVGVVIGVPGK